MGEQLSSDPMFLGLNPAAVPALVNIAKRKKFYKDSKNELSSIFHKMSSKERHILALALSVA